MVFLGEDLEVSVIAVGIEIPVTDFRRILMIIKTIFWIIVVRLAE